MRKNKILADLGSGFKDAFLQILSDRSVLVRSTAGQAHWQNGVAERHGGAWKEIWNNLVEDCAILDDEVSEAMAATTDAKNQWILTKTVGVRDTDEDDSVTVDSKMGRRHVIQIGVRAAFFQCQTKQALQRAIAHKTRVTAPMTRAS